MKTKHLPKLPNRVKKRLIRNHFCQIVTFSISLLFSFILIRSRADAFVHGDKTNHKGFFESITNTELMLLFIIVVLFGSLCSCAGYLFKVTNSDEKFKFINWLTAIMCGTILSLLTTLFSIEKDFSEEMTLLAAGISSIFYFQIFNNLTMLFEFILNKFSKIHLKSDSQNTSSTESTSQNVSSTGSVPQNNTVTGSVPSNTTTT